MKLKETLNKHGGVNLLKQYLKGGTFLVAMGELLLLGKSRTSLEILRLSTQLKSKQKLAKKYRKELGKFDSSYDNNLSHEVSNKVWVCWFEGIDKAPFIVQKCYQSLKDNLKNREIVLITSKNMLDYVRFPEIILEKWRTGIITDTHMTDLLRLELLVRYGGMWLDATVLCTEKEENIPSYFFESDLFFFQYLKPGKDGHSHINSSWLISAKKNNKVLMACKHLCYAYWKEHDYMIDYFLLHNFMAICLEYYSYEHNSIVPRDNATPHILYLRLFKEYDEVIWTTIKKQVPFHKLSYKFEKDLSEITGTYYDVLFGDRRLKT